MGFGRNVRTLVTLLSPFLLQSLTLTYTHESPMLQGTTGLQGRVRTATVRGQRAWDSSDDIVLGSTLSVHSLSRLEIDQIGVRGGTEMFFTFRAALDRTTVLADILGIVVGREVTGGQSASSPLSISSPSGNFQNSLVR